MADDITLSVPYRDDTVTVKVPKKALKFGPDGRLIGGDSEFISKAVHDIYSNRQMKGKEPGTDVPMITKVPTLQPKVAGVPQARGTQVDTPPKPTPEPVGPWPKVVQHAKNIGSAYINATNPINIVRSQAEGASEAMATPARLERGMANIPVPHSIDEAIGSTLPFVAGAIPNPEYFRSGTKGAFEAIKEVEPNLSRAKNFGLLGGALGAATSVLKGHSPLSGFYAGSGLGLGLDALTEYVPQAIKGAREATQGMSPINPAITGVYRSLFPRKPLQAEFVEPKAAPSHVSNGFVKMPDGTYRVPQDYISAAPEAVVNENPPIARTGGSIPMPGQVNPYGNYPPGTAPEPAASINTTPTHQLPAVPPPAGLLPPGQYPNLPHPMGPVELPPAPEPINRGNLLQNDPTIRIEPTSTRLPGSLEDYQKTAYGEHVPKPVEAPKVSPKAEPTKTEPVKTEPPKTEPPKKTIKDVVSKFKKKEPDPNEMNVEQIAKANEPKPAPEPVVEKPIPEKAKSPEPKSKSTNPYDDVITESQVRDFVNRRLGTRHGDLQDEFGLSEDKAKQLLVGLESKGEIARSGNNFVRKPNEPITPKSKPVKPPIKSAPKENLEDYPDDEEVQTGPKTKSRPVEVAADAIKRQRLAHLRSLDELTGDQEKEINKLIDWEKTQPKKTASAEPKKEDIKNEEPKSETSEKPINENPQSQTTKKRSEPIPQEKVSSIARSLGLEDATDKISQYLEEETVSHDSIGKIAEASGRKFSQVAKVLEDHGVAVQPSKFGGYGLRVGISGINQMFDMAGRDPAKFANIVNQGLSEEFKVNWGSGTVKRADVVKAFEESGGDVEAFKKKVKSLGHSSKE